MATTRKGRVLVVDDNEDAAVLLAEVLEHLGHQVQIAHDGVAALRVAADFRPEVALLDIGLPRLDGYQLALRLRELPGQVGLGLVAITGYGQPGDRARALAAGFDDHLVKPIDLQQVERIIDRLLARAAG